MIHLTRITEDELMERARERYSEANVNRLETRISQQAMQIAELEQQVRELSENTANRKLNYVINLLGLRYANDSKYIHTAFTDTERRELAGLLCVAAYSEVQ